MVACDACAADGLGEVVGDGFWLLRLIGSMRRISTNRNALQKNDRSDRRIVTVRPRFLEHGSDHVRYGAGMRRERVPQTAAAGDDQPLHFSLAVEACIRPSCRKRSRMVAAIAL